MSIFDFILFPLYVYLFHVIFSKRRKRIQDPVLQKYHLYAFWIRIGSTLAFTVLGLTAIRGDSITLYYPEGVNLFHLILKNFSNIKYVFLPGSEYDTSLTVTDNVPGYFVNESNFFIIQLVTFLSFFTFGSYLILNLFFSLFAFTGMWRLYKFFYEQYPHLHKQLAIAILFFPTLVFWTSGILKDPICMGMFGWLTYSLFKIFVDRKSIFKNLIVAGISGTVLGLVKGYILFSFLPFFFLFIILRKLYRIKNFIIKIASWALLIYAGWYGFTSVSSQLQDEAGSQVLDNFVDNVKNQQTNYINMSDLAGSSFSLGVEFDGTTAGLVKIAPAAITATLFRPFLWESRNLTTLLSSLESLALMLFTLYVCFKVGPFNFIRSFFKNPMILFCFCFSLLFALIVGTITLNFGTLVRYKIPCIPFYIVSLCLILDYYKKRKQEKIDKKEVAIQLIPEFSSI